MKEIFFITTLNLFLFSKFEEIKPQNECFLQFDLYNYPLSFYPPTIETYKENESAYLLKSTRLKNIYCELFFSEVWDINSDKPFTEDSTWVFQGDMVMEYVYLSDTLTFFIDSKKNLYERSSRIYKISSKNLKGIKEVLETWPH